MIELLTHDMIYKEPFVVKPEWDPCSLDLETVSLMFRDRFLLEKESFFVLDKNTLTIDSSIYLADYKLEAEHLRTKFKDNNIVVVKNLESYNEVLSETCRALGESVNLHMYLTPNNGESFKTHKDDRHVFIRQVVGKKVVICEIDGKESVFSLDVGDWLHIPIFTKHRAINVGPSISLSFGALDSAPRYVSNGITKEDLEAVYDI